MFLFLIVTPLIRKLCISIQSLFYFVTERLYFQNQLLVFRLKNMGLNSRHSFVNLFMTAAGCRLHREKSPTKSSTNIQENRRILKQLISCLEINIEWRKL